MAPRLFENKVGGNCTEARSSDNNDFINCNSTAVTAIARYSTSVEERAIVHCFVELHEIGLAPRTIRKALMEVRSSGLLAQSALSKMARI